MPFPYNLKIIIKIMTDYSEIKHTLKRVALNLEMPKQKKTTAFIIKEKKVI